MKTFFNVVKIITWLLCCWPQDLQRIINFKLTDTSNNLYCTVLGKEILVYYFPSCRGGPDFTPSLPPSLHHFPLDIHGGRLLACNAGVFWCRSRSRASAFWSSKCHLGFKLGRGLGETKMRPREWEFGFSQANMAANSNVAVNLRWRAPKRKRLHCRLVGCQGFSSRSFQN